MDSVREKKTIQEYCSQFHVDIRKMWTCLELARIQFKKCCWLDFLILNFLKSFFFREVNACMKFDWSGKSGGVYCTSYSFESLNRNDWITNQHFFVDLDFTNPKKMCNDNLVVPHSFSEMQFKWITGFCFQIYEHWTRAQHFHLKQEHENSI